MATTPFDLGRQAAGAVGTHMGVGTDVDRRRGVVKSPPAKPLPGLNKSIKGEATGAPIHYSGPERSPGNAYSPYSHTVQGNVKDVKAWQDRMAPGDQQNIAVNNRTGQAISNAPAYVISPSGRDPDEVQAQLTADYERKSKARQADLGLQRSNMDARSRLAEDVAAGRRPASALLDLRTQQKQQAKPPSTQVSGINPPMPAAPVVSAAPAATPGAPKSPAELDMIPQGEQKFTKAPDAWDAAIDKNIRDPNRPALTTAGIPSKGVPFGAMADTERGMKEWNKPRALTGDSTIDRLTDPNYMKTRPDHVQRINEETQQGLAAIRGSSAAGPEMQQVLNRRAADPAREADIAEARRRHDKPNEAVRPLTMADQRDIASGRMAAPAAHAPLGAAGKAEAARLVNRDTAWANKREQINREATEAEIKGHAERNWQQHTRNDEPLDYQTRLTLSARGDQHGRLLEASKPKPTDATSDFQGIRPEDAGARIGRAQRHQESLHSSPEARKFQTEAPHYLQGKKQLGVVNRPEKYLQITGQLPQDRTKAIQATNEHIYQSQRAPSVAAKQQEGFGSWLKNTWDDWRPGNWDYVRRADGTRAGVTPAPRPLRRFLQNTHDFYANPVDTVKAHFEETNPVMRAAREFGRNVARAGGRT